MKINSELPMCMLDQNNDLNEYDFVLFHLYISNESYKNYYLNQHKKYPNRLMIFDNSAYEFFIKGESLNIQKFVEAINELKPDYYILPDVLMDFQTTYNNTKSFLENYNITCSQPIGVIQGNTSNELIACMLLYIDLKIKAIAVPFHNSFYKNYNEQFINLDFATADMMDVYNTNKLTDDMKYALGRVSWVRQHISYLNKFEYIHLLGSHCPLEKSYYKNLGIDTMDTGYPVKCAIAGYELFKEPKKPEIIIDDFMTDDLSDKKELIRYNVTKFRLL